MGPSNKRFVVFTTEDGNKIGVNPEHVTLVEPRSHGTTITLAGPGTREEATRRVNESFDEVMRSLRGEERPRLPH
ncbi:MAG TPA: hypothetical protein VE967_01065 [Gemmatimonadaceae bacterium]|nr:hypothetical protein [Gemmatimonadaceae bacterium]